MMTLNLHLAQHLPDQARARGPLALHNELWVERALQPHKQCTQHRVSRRPEAVITRQLADDRALAILGRKPGMHTFDQLVPTFRCKVLDEPRYDSGSPDTPVQMLHCARPVRMRDRQELLEVLKRYRNEHPAEDGQPLCLSPPELESSRGWQIFTAARTHTGVIQSRLHTRATRVSCFVTIQDRVPGTNRPCTLVAEVLHFVRILRQARGLQPVRLAICRTFKEQGRKEGMFVARKSLVQQQKVALDLESLGAALVTVKPADGSDKIFGVPYFSQSRAA